MRPIVFEYELINYLISLSLYIGYVIIIIIASNNNIQPSTVLLSQSPSG